MNADGELTLKGYEVTWVQPLGRLFEPLEGFGFNLNYTHVDAERPGRRAGSRHRHLAGSVQRHGVLRARPGFGARSRYVWSEEQIQSQFNEQGIALARRFGDAYKQLDLSASYEFAGARRRARW